MSTIDTGFAVALLRHLPEFGAVWRLGLPRMAGALLLLIITVAGPTNRAFAQHGWLPNHVGPGVNGVVYATAVYNGNLYVGGQFTLAFAEKVSNIARWDGSAWHDVGGGTDGTVYALAVYGNELYAGGAFGEAATNSPAPITVSSIARWNNSTSSDVGGGVIAGLQAGVRALKVFNDGTNDKLIVAGDFSMNFPQADDIAAWDGTTWSALGGGLLGQVGPPGVYSLAVYQGKLFAGVGYQANCDGGASSGGLQMLNAGAWECVAGTADIHPYALEVFDAGNGTELIIGGADGSPSQAGVLMRWNGAGAPQIFQGGVHGGVVRAMRVYDGRLIVAGSFDQIGTLTGCNRIAQWWGPSDTQWTRLTDSVNIHGFGGGNGVGGGDVNTLTVQNGRLIVAGGFRRAAGLPAAYIAEWSGPGNSPPIYASPSWRLLGPVTYLNTDAFMRSLAVYRDELYIGGSIGGVNYNPDTLSFTPVDHIARWNGMAWIPMPGFPAGDAYVYAMRAWQDRLVVGGHFAQAGGTPARQIAAWDGTQWTAFSGGVGNDSGSYSRVRAIAEFQGELYVAGLFNRAWNGMNPVPVRNIARWTGTMWQSIPGFQYLGSQAEVLALEVVDGELYAGGYIDQDEVGNNLSFIARWNGTAWQPVGAPGQTGLDSPVQALYDDSGSLQVAGFFSGVRPPPSPLQLNFVATWDPAVSSWAAFSNTLQQYSNLGSGVAAIARFAGDLYIGGSFRIVDGGAITARWNHGTQLWERMGASGLTYAATPYVFCVHPYRSELYFGGLFSAADGRPAFSLARWGEPPPFMIVGQPLDASARPLGTAEFSVGADGLGPITYEWARDGQPLTNGPTKSGSLISGANASVLVISRISAADQGTYSCIVSSPSGPLSSDPAVLSIDCAADFNNDGTANSQDFFDFLVAIFAMDPSADFNDDGLINSQDFFDFLNVFFAGC